MGFCGTRLKPISREVLKNSIIKVRLKNTLVKLLPHSLRPMTKGSVVNIFQINYIHVHGDKQPGIFTASLARLLTLWQSNIHGLFH